MSQYIIPNDIIIKILDFPSLLIVNKSIKENITKNIFSEKEILYNEEMTNNVFSKIEHDIEKLYKYCWNSVNLDDSEKTDILKRHTKYPWIDRIEYFLMYKECIYHVDIIEEYLMKWNKDVRCFINAVSIDNINIVSYYISKGIIYEDPEIIEKRHNDKILKKHPILDTAFKIASALGSVKMMTFLWNSTSTPYLDLTYADPSIIKRVDNMNARMFLANRLFENKWEYEEELNVIGFLKLLKRERCLNTYKFLFDKEGDVDIYDYKKIAMLTLQNSHFDIYQVLIEELNLTI